ncbi:Transcriptional regulatory protein CpxR [Vibrio stylophorae]|uniref:Transcriptional regulatory protein CpxR n=1 Tax=Vibrio stylophorae TaxID=659351 RepID=A0ABN8DU60_9VIBR|nr:response regulator [Vibrio stylophorae]CAH0534579.1 Transcriptional regulatory protein CpxR [Vibrio stylophorae]
MHHILLVDDDQELTSLLADLLALENFSVTICNDGEAGLAHAISTPPDLILLDVMMPKLNGIEMLRRLREQSDTPVIMLTAKGEEIDRVLGLELGADDYLPKPFSDRELLARMRAILRRSQSQNAGAQQSANPGDMICHADLQLFPRQQEAQCQQQTLDLTSTEFALLGYLIAHAGQVVSKEALSLDVLGKRLAPFDRAVDMHLSNLRKKLPPRFDSKPRVKTLRGRGYLWVD